MARLTAFLISAIAALGCGGFSALAHGADTKAAFDIPAQPLAMALRAIAEQTGLQVVYETDLAVDLKSPGVKGELSVREAFEKVLEGSGLKYEFLSERTVAVSEVGRKTALQSGLVTDVAIRLAQAESQSGMPAAGAPTGTEPAQSDPLELEEVVVTGTHIRGTKNDLAPVIVLDKAYIDSTGISTTAALIESLPQNFALANQAAVSTVAGVSGAKAQGSSINLRGVGEGTTLVLLNGRRLASGFVGAAVDISALPLSAIERVEVLTNGASAIYGSDAVGGVVNFILRDDFKGAETRLRAGSAKGGVNEYRVSQLLGNDWESGNALLSLEYYKRDLLPADERDFVPDAAEIGSLFPRDKNYSAMFSGRQNLTEAVQLFADALYTKRDSFNEGGRIINNENNSTENPQLSATLGLDWRLGSDWRIEASGGYARNKLDQIQRSSTDFRGNTLFGTRFEIDAAQVKADGSIFKLPGGSVRAAIGADWRTEKFRSTLAFTGRGVVPPQTTPPNVKDQIVRSAFAEVLIPLVGADNVMSGARRLELSLASRFDDYSSFGSSFDPQFALMWEPIGGLRLRGTYGTSYVAPRLVDYDTSSGFTLAQYAPDASLPSGFLHRLEVIGNDPAGFSAQQSENWSFGVEFDPPAVPGLQLGLNYYHIDYTDRIANPPPVDVVLANPSSFGSLIIENPTAEQVNELVQFGQSGQGFFPFTEDFSGFEDPFDPNSIDVIVDIRKRNLSVTQTNGLDVSMQYAFDAMGGSLQLGLAGTYIFELTQQVTAASAPFDTVDTFYNPPDWRLRASFGWQRQRWSTNLFVNHMDSYVDNRNTPVTPISSYTTMDGRLAYAFDRSGASLLSGVTVSANVQNLFDRDPPATRLASVDFDMGFDPTNANPMGRLVAIELTKVW